MMSKTDHETRAEAGGAPPSDGGASPQLDPTAGKTVAEIFGEIVWLMTQDPRCVGVRIGDLERLVMPAILLKQFHITYALVPNAQGGSETSLQPCKAELYALMSEDVATRLQDSAIGLLGLSLPDWRSGPLKRVILTASLPSAR